MEQIQYALNTVLGFFNWLKPTGFFAIYGSTEMSQISKLEETRLWRGKVINYDLGYNMK